MQMHNFQNSQVSSFDFSKLYTSLPHDLLKANMLLPVNWCFNGEPKTYLCTSNKAGLLNNKKHDLYKYWACIELFETFTFPMKTIYTTQKSLESLTI